MVTDFEANFEAAMEGNALGSSSPVSSWQSKPSQSNLTLPGTALGRKFKRSTSIGTAATEDSSCCDSSTGRCAKSPTSLVSQGTPGRRRSMISMSALTSKNPVSPAGITLEEDESFNCTDESDWWQQQDSPQNESGRKKKTLSEHLPETTGFVSESEDQSASLDSKTVDSKDSVKRKDKKKKKMKRISVTKVKASDMANCPMHELRTKDGAKPANEQELQEAFALWKEEQKRQKEKDRRAPERARSKSRARLRPTEDESSDEQKSSRSRSVARSSGSGERSKSVARSRSKSVSRRRSEANIIENEDGEKPKKSVLRRSNSDDGHDNQGRARSVARRRSEDEDGRKRSKSLARNRGRSVGRRRSNDGTDDEEKPRSKSSARGMRSEESDDGGHTRGRSVARPRGRCRDSNEEDNGDDRRRSKSLARGLPKSPKDTPEDYTLEMKMGQSFSSFEHVPGDDHLAILKSRRGVSRKASRSRSNSLTRRSSKKQEDEEFMKMAHSSLGKGDSFFDFSADDDEKGDQGTDQKGIPWDKFLLEAQTTSRK